jgi:hypothetical protein
MAESGRIAARKLRGMFRRMVAGAGFRKVSTTVITMPATPPHAWAPCANDFAFPPRICCRSRYHPKMQRLTSSTIDLGAKLVRQWTNLPD